MSAGATKCSLLYGASPLESLPIFEPRTDSYSSAHALRTRAHTRILNTFQFGFEGTSFKPVHTCMSCKKSHYLLTLPSRCCSRTPSCPLVFASTKPVASKMFCKSEGKVSISRWSAHLGGWVPQLLAPLPSWINDRRTRVTSAFY